MSKYKSTHTGEQIDQYLDEAHALHVKERSMPPVINLMVSASESVSITQNMRDGSSLSLSIPQATTTKAGVMSAADKAKLDGAAAQEYVDAFAEVVIGNEETERTHHLQSVTNIAASPYAGGVDLEVYKGGSQSPSHVDMPSATTSAAGVMSAADKTKLDGIDPNNIQPKSFVATYGTTTYQEIVNAKNAGKDIVCYYGGISYHRATEVNGEFINVRKDPDGRINVRWLNVDTSNAWTYGNYELYKESAERQKYINAGATYNAATGYYSLNGLTDITEEEMAVIYADTYRKQCGKDMSYMLAGSKARTNLPARNRTSGEYGLTTALLFGSCSKMEIIKWGEPYSDDHTSPLQYYGHIALCTEMFNGCISVHTIIGAIDMESITAKPINMFGNCNALENVQILALKTSLDLQSPVISHDSLMFLVEHAANTLAITVKVHQDVWARINSTEWGDIYVAATAKNISFAY